MNRMLNSQSCAGSGRHSRPPQSLDRSLCDSIVFYAAIDPFGSRLAYARYVRFRDFIERFEPPADSVTTT
ncbi:MAG TPA: hypothetical protein VGR35_05365 [Tepidisphaeraceae bacterium]|nr:hypothetical protein [Tepidisphaeraceae bacterium]